MKEKTTLLLLLICAFINAQSIDSATFANGGELQSNGTNSINATIGEPIVGTISNSETVHQGFWASSFSNETLDVATSIRLDKELTVFPNPVINKLTITSNLLKDYEYTIYNAEGKLITQDLVNNKLVNTINVTGLPDGMYLLKISDRSASFTKTIKFLKQ